MNGFPFMAFLFDSIGSGELLVIFLVSLLLFGPKRLPEIARTLGKAMEQLRRASREFHDQIEKIAEEEGSSGEASSPVLAASEQRGPHDGQDAHDETAPAPSALAKAAEDKQPSPVSGEGAIRKTPNGHLNHDLAG